MTSKAIERLTDAVIKANTLDNMKADEWLTPGSDFAMRLLASNIANAVLRTIRDPAPEMVDEGARALQREGLGAECVVLHELALAAFQAMIDQALKET